MVFEKNLGSAKTFENAKALKGNIVASEGITLLSLRRYSVREIVYLRIVL